MTKEKKDTKNTSPEVSTPSVPKPEIQVESEVISRYDKLFWEVHSGVVKTLKDGGHNPGTVLDEQAENAILDTLADYLEKQKESVEKKAVKLVVKAIEAEKKEQSKKEWAIKMLRDLKDKGQLDDYLKAIG